MLVIRAIDNWLLDCVGQLPPSCLVQQSLKATFSAMIRTIFFFGIGGFWTACFSNGLRHHHIMRSKYLLYSGRDYSTAIATIRHIV